MRISGLAGVPQVAPSTESDSGQTASPVAADRSNRAGADPRRLRAAMFPDYRASNPYQRLLVESLGQEGVQCDFPSGYKRGLHFSRRLGIGGGSGAGYDLIHLHWPDSYLRGKSLWSRRLYAEKLWWDLRMATRRRPLVWTVHNLNRHDLNEDPVEKRFYRRLARLARRLFVHDDSLIAPVVERLRVEREKIVVIPHGHYGDFYGPVPPRKEARARLRIPDDARVVLFLGMIRPYKGLEDLIEVWPAVRAAVPEALLLIVGGGRLEGYIEEIRQRVNAVEGVRLDARYVADAEIPCYYGAVDAAVFPFRSITTSGSLILALSYGKPVVTPDVPSIARKLDFLGPLLYPPGSQAGLRNSLITSLDEPLGDWEKEFAAVREDYSWEHTAALTAASYRAVLNEI